MKKNNRINLLLSIFLVLVLVSCDKQVLNTKPLNKFSAQSIWNSYPLAQAFVDRDYSRVDGLYITRNFGFDEWTTNCDNINNNPVASGSISNTFNAGWVRYGFIRDCDIIIGEAQKSKGMSPAEKKDILGQGYFLRAMTYYELARKFGHFMLVDTLLTPSDTLDLPETTTKESYGAIISDLDKAINDLPVTAPQGLATKGAAYAMKERVALQAGAYIKSERSQYDKMVTKAFQNLMALNKYKLDPDYAGLFNTYTGAQTSPEVILGDYRVSTNTTFGDTPMQWIVANNNNAHLKPGATPLFVNPMFGWASRFPTQNLVNDYLVVDKDGVAKMWNQTSYYQNYEMNGGYVSNAIYKHRDKRFYASIVYDSTQYYGNTVTTRLGGNMNWTSTTNNEPYVSKTGYFYKKGVYQDTQLGYSKHTPYFWEILGLGEAYLNYAEASLLLGETSQAINAINQTRTIHGGLPPLSTGLSSQEAWKYYKIERRVELFAQNDYYWSLLRWGLYNGGGSIPSLNKVPSAIEISSDGKSFNIIQVPNAGANQRSFSPRRYLFPIPLSQIQGNPKLKQNPGW